MTHEQRIEWFRFVLEKDLPGRIRKAIETLVGAKVARGLIDSGGWIEPVGDEEFSTWIPPEPIEEREDAPATEDDVDTAIARALAQDPGRVRRVAEELLRDAAED